jgi:hypothetical protein
MSSPPNTLDGSRGEKLWAAVAWGAIGVAVLFRFLLLDRIPGINGDEAYYGVRAVDLLQGDPVSWKTGTGLPLNPFYFLTLVPWHAIFDPSFVLLRINAALFGCAAIFFVWRKYRRIVDEHSAWAMTLLVACLPATVSYSRIGWDMALNVPVTALIVYCSQRRMLGATLGALVAGAVVHPSIVLITPLAATPFVLHLREHGTARVTAWLQNQPRPALVAKLALGAVVVLGVGLLLLAKIAPLLDQHLPGALERLIEPSQLALFAFHYGNLIDGATIYSYFVGPPPHALLISHAIAFWVVVLAIVLLNLLRRSSALPDLIGLTICLALHYVAGGPEDIRPHHDRYALWCVVPSAFVFVRLLGQIVPPRIGARIVTGLSLVLLASFAINYFHAATQTNCTSHPTFLTGREEPKASATRLILDHPGEDKRVFVEDWWLYWPMRYLLSREKQVRITIFQRRWDDRFPPDFDFEECLALGGAAYYVGFTGGELTPHVQEHYEISETIRVGGYPEGAPVIDVSVVQAPPPPRCE